MDDAPEQQVSCKALPTLPVDVWARILQLIVSESLYPIQELARLQLISRTVLQAARSVPLSVEVNSAQQLEGIQLFLQACPCAWLRFHKRVDGESILRHENFRASSARSLKELWAVVACTDTLAFFPVLEGLTLEAGAIHRFYPSVLGGLTCLRSLSLVRFPIMELSGLTPNVVKTLKVCAGYMYAGGGCPCAFGTAASQQPALYSCAGGRHHPSSHRAPVLLPYRVPAQAAPREVPPPWFLC